jgi:hypothetical protein
MNNWWMSSSKFKGLGPMASPHSELIWNYEFWQAVGRAVKYREHKYRKTRTPAHIPVLQRSKILRALDRTATVIG